MSATAETMQGFEPRHRVVGAIILVALGVIFLPVAFDEKKGADARSMPAIEIPDRDSKIFISRITPIEVKEEGAKRDKPAKKETKPVEKKVAAPAETRAAPALAPVAAADKPAAVMEQAAVSDSPPESVVGEKVEQAPPTEKPAAAEKKAAVAEKSDKGWIVQIGSFSSADNAKRILSGLQQKGFKPDTRKVDTPQGKATRIWIGPFPERATAEEMQARVRKETGQAGLVVAYP